MSGIKTLLRKIVWLKRGIYTSLRKATGKSDYRKWSNNKNLRQDWDTRTEQMAKLIEPGTSVIEFGAGKLVLKTLLPTNCSYTPSDLVHRGEDTIVCDLNNDPLPKFKSYDVAVLSGVFEYVNDVPKVVSHLSHFVDTIIASYAVTDTNKSNRGVMGWVNYYSSVEFIKIFENAGFQCTHTEPYKSQVIYKFTKEGV
ncbi:hypothetical protein A2738_03865 [Candidatus Nomurabacteria bacterium RIFCSPHIGHO2_01_FULL_42_15]|uniref:Methyltransferase type 11 domain-containing protein n=1 Tax=Candidatus Nomurabacteria bacterium RIFCSPHIGHO2_01_FULL_42_15 TaxID=1801742 RepID=A0A1F6VEF9_9BACT|nr:MAG: hypothetical protein A2738_03865 [Candidatus Nomurabacteria bacterium RIFCSPHIGHO2_01_FULL_42_15]OGI93340.1 MAG: hypothetical protein A3A99_03720 [Candidatus Nomurabacteria bacterium RIFCSPLOWO2_01_FULL_41_18]